jgi:concentrative nucleoside transporter, CNT family
MDLSRVFFGIFGLSVLVGVATLFSRKRDKIDWQLVATGLGLQIVFAGFVLLGPNLASHIGVQFPRFDSWWRPLVKTGLGLALLISVVSELALFEAARAQLKRVSGYLGLGAAAVGLPLLGEAFTWLAQRFVQLTEYTRQGSQFIFGDLVDLNKFGFIFAFQVLPTIIFFAAFMGVLYHLGVMQWIVRGMASMITKVMRVSGAETTSVCASVFIGQTEAPLTVRPYIAKMTDSELLTMMIGGMAHIAGGVMATYVQMLGGADLAAQAVFAKHFLAASIMAAPATLLIAKILVPETGDPLTRGQVRVHVEKHTNNVIEAAAGGAADGLKLALNIAAMLLAFIALIALFNGMLGWVSDVTGITSMLTSAAANAQQLPVAQVVPVRMDLQMILGQLLRPLAWIIGVPWGESTTVGGLIGQKVVINEFVAYLQLSNMKPDALSHDARIIATYALCGFANFSSIAIQIGGIGGLAPERRGDLARFGLLAVLGGSLATFMTATIAGVMLHFI